MLYFYVGLAIRHGIRYWHNTLTLWSVVIDVVVGCLRGLIGLNRGDHWWLLLNWLWLLLSCHCH